MYAMLHQFFNDITNRNSFTETSDFLKQMIILSSFKVVIISDLGQRQKSA